MGPNKKIRQKSLSGAFFESENREKRIVIGVLDVYALGFMKLEVFIQNIIEF